MRYGVEVAIGDYPSHAVRVSMLVEAESAQAAQRTAENFVKAGPVQAVNVWQEG